MPASLKRKRRDWDDAEATDFVQLLCDQAAKDGVPSETLQLIWKLKAEVAQQSKTKPASSYTRIELVAKDFQLDYDEPNCVWRVSDLVKGQGFQPSSCLGSFISEFDRNLLRTSEANCRVLVALILSEVLSHLKGPKVKRTKGSVTPPPMTSFENLKVCAELSFSAATPEKAVVTGRIDFGVGHDMAPDDPRRRFKSLLLVVEAKLDGFTDAALPQLAAYLASLRHYRKANGRSDTAVFGFATDGVMYRFMTITHDGVILLTRSFWLREEGDRETILALIHYLLQKANDMSPNVTPVKSNSSTSAHVPFEYDPLFHPDDLAYEVESDSVEASIPGQDQ